MAQQYEIWQEGAIQGPYEAAQLRAIWERAQWPPGTLWRRCGAAQFSLPEELAQEFASSPDASTAPGPTPAATAAGTRLIPCPACGRQVSNQAPACPGCGHQLKPPAVPAAPAPISISIDQAMVRVPKSRAVYIILGLFLGGLGVHNFYIGRVATGLIQLLITLLLGWLFVPLFIVGFWVIIEVIAVNADAEGHRLR